MDEKKEDDKKKEDGEKKEDDDIDEIWDFPKDWPDYSKQLVERGGGIYFELV
jgi:hypothetical protein